MKEWVDPYNSFNSNKGLLYSKWYESIERGIFLPPIEASLDPIHACNLMCQHCNAHRYLNKPKRMTDKHLLDLVKFLGQWGVKAICFGGGGEPTLHTKLPEAIDQAKQWGMESSVATNGTLLNPRLIEAMTLCRWVGVSVDAATSKTYKIGRKQNLFNRAIKNIELLVKKVKETSSKCDVSFKFLLFDYNQHEVFEACKLAKSLGIRDFHVRPADFSHQGMGSLAKKGGYDVKSVLAQFERCFSLASDDFRVFTVVHKFDSTFHHRKNFSQCYAAPCCIQLCADGNIYLCPDQRHQKHYRIGRHEPIRGIRIAWGSEKHQDLVFNSGRKGCTSRCTFSPYNEQCERLFIRKDDPFCWRFI